MALDKETVVLEVALVEALKGKLSVVEKLASMQERDARIVDLEERVVAKGTAREAERPGAQSYLQCASSFLYIFESVILLYRVP
jgi:hypothetical protein